MKRIVKIFLGLTAVVLCAAALTACGENEFEGKITGAAIMTTADASNSQRIDQVRIGDKVKLTIGATAEQPCGLSIVIISGVSYAPEVHYCIDGQRVGKSRDENTFFAVDYEVKDLTPGQHTLSVDVPDMYGNINYTVRVQPTTFNVVE